MKFKKSVLVTGSKGYVGKETVSKLKKEYNIISVDIKDNQDCKNFKDLKKQIIKANYVIHLSAHKNIKESINNPIKYYYNNILSTLNIVILCKMYKKPLVFSSSASVYCKNNPYAKSKNVEEILIKFILKKYVILRYFNIGGATENTNDQGSGNLFSIINNNTKINIWNKGSTRDYIHISDVANANLLSIKYLEENNKPLITDIFTGKKTSVNEILNLYMEHNINFDIDYYNLKDSEITPKNDNRNILGWEPKYSLKDIVESELQHICN
jgi:UDP-glucose 4-epimerase